MKEHIGFEGDGSPSSKRMVVSSTVFASRVLLHTFPVQKIGLIELFPRMQSYSNNTGIFVLQLSDE